jgi:hypothetical protein
MEFDFFHLDSSIEHRNCIVAYLFSREMGKRV